MSEGREDIAKLYSRAHLGHAKYLDFSASRKQVRGKFRRGLVNPPRERSLLSQFFSQPAKARPPARSMDRPSQPDVALSPRWYALHSLLRPSQRIENPETTLSLPRPSSLLVLSVAGGVGKTCLVATLGRALVALGERVLLADTAEYGLLPFYYGSRTYSSGVMRTFTPPGSSPDSHVPDREARAPIRILNLPAAQPGDRGAGPEPLLEKLLGDGQMAGRILVDVATANRESTSRLLQLGSPMLVPILPDMSSVASLPLLQSVLTEAENTPATVFYLLNQFDESTPLHVDVRALLEEELGDRLLPLVLRRSSAVSEALAEGMTVLDYAPQSEAAEDYRNLAHWLRSLSPPPRADHGGGRWTEG
jgi:cellulose synthase operon protein YhjQ